MKTRAEFQQFYEQTMRGELLGLEEKRKSILPVIIAVDAVVVFAAIVVTFLKVHIMVTAMITAIILALVYKFVTSGYRKEFKPAVIKRIVDFTLPGLAYESDKSIPENVFRASRIFLRAPDRYQGEDLICGKIGETGFECSEVHAEYKTSHTDRNGHRDTKWHTIFRGLFFTAEFNKNFNGSTVVLPDVAQKLLGELGAAAQSWNIARGELIRLEDPEFEKLFVVYGNDQIEARYILSPSLMNRMTEFKKKSGREVFFSFAESKICVAVSYTGPLFEPSVFKTLLNFESFLPYFEDLHLAIGIVDDLNLNTRIWSKT